MDSTQQKLAEDIAALAEVVDDVVDKYNELKSTVDAANDPANAGTNTADIDLSSLESSIAELRTKILGATESAGVGTSATDTDAGAHFDEGATGSAAPDTTPIGGVVQQGDVTGNDGQTVDLGTPSTPTGEAGTGLPTELSEGTTVEQPIVDHEHQDETTDPTA